ncbi:MAG TPA: hypothetical protein VE733_04605 [Streptosporangiaceae bacterium]|jgi:hypothetical protein|nr:hypothetical protein [Streptosporangiaceae bacterium]
MTAVRWRKDDNGVDRGEEYLELRERRPAEAAVVRDAINTILRDPEVAAQKYSVLLDRESRTLVMPYLRTVGRLTVLAWFNDPDDDAIEIIDFSQMWTDDLDMPRVYLATNRSPLVEWIHKGSRSPRLRSEPQVRETLFPAPLGTRREEEVTPRQVDNLFVEIRTKIIDPGGLKEKPPVDALDLAARR